MVEEIEEMNLGVIGSDRLVAEFFLLLLGRTVHEHVEVPGRTMTDSLESGTVAGNVQLHSPCFACS